MLRMLSVLLFGLALCVTAGVRADDKKDSKKEVTLKGTITCAKCDLGEADKCATVIKVKEGGKDVVYYFDADAHKKNHGPICKSPKEGTVTGTVSEKDGKKIVTVTKVDMKKD